MIQTRVHRPAQLTTLAAMAPKVLIIGASSAIATEVARSYARAGARLYLIARNAARLEALVEELEPAIVGSRSVDLAQLDQAAPCVEAAIAALGGLDVVLIAHGYLGDQLRSERELDEALTSLQINLLSPLALLIPLANALEHQAREQDRGGHIGVITSVAGERGRPRNFTYGAAKGGLSHYLEGLRSRLYATGVHVHNFKLGPVDTPMTAKHAKNALFAQPQPVAAAIVRGLGGRRHVVFVPGYWRWIMLVVRNTPEPLFQRLRFLSGR